MTVTVLEPTTIEDLDFRPGCQGTTFGREGKIWEEFPCSSEADLARIKACGCVVMHCMPCRDKTKEAIESAIAKTGLGWGNFFCTICMTRAEGVRSYWGLTLREVPLR